METLYHYIVTSFTVSLIAGIGERMAPVGMKKYVTFIASLILLIFLITPLTSLGEELFGFADEVLDKEIQMNHSANTHEGILIIARKKAEEAIQKHLNDTFCIQNYVLVSLDMEMQENDTILLKHISLKLSEMDQPLASEIEAYLEKEFSTETTVMISEE